MKGFHSTVSRREFMKALGLTGAGMGAAGLVKPVFHDLDELVSSYNSSHPWWVKSSEFEDLTTPVDWDIYSNYDAQLNPMPTTSEENNAYRKQRDADYTSEGVNGKIPGRDTRCLALEQSVRGICPDPEWDFPGTVKGVVPWEDNSENNLQMLRAAIQYFGCTNSGGVPMNEHMKRVSVKDTVSWENIDTGYRTEKPNVDHVPDKCQSMIVWLVQQNYTQALYELREDPSRTGGLSLPMPLGRPAVHRAYGEARLTQHLVQNFIGNLGYQVYAPKGFGTCNVALGAFAGLGECGRVTYLGAPRSGICNRVTKYAVTDLPIEPTPPIDFGFAKFCQSCNRCGEMCPGESISQEKEMTWEAGPGNNLGYKAFRMNWQSCRDQGAPSRCGVCHKLCPFNHPNDSIVHPIVRSAAAATPVFNGFFAQMDRNFGYNKPKAENELINWWTRDPYQYKGDTYYGAGRYSW